MQSLKTVCYHMTADNTYCHLIRENLTQPSKVLGLLVNTLTADDKFPLLNRDNFIHPIQMQLSQKQKKFAQFFSAVLKFKLNFEHSQKRMTLIAYLFPKLRTPKNVVR